MSTHSQDHERLDFVKMQITESINIYKHHQELFLKWVGVYGAVLATIGVYVFHNDLTPYGRRLIPAVTALSSLVVIQGCLAMWMWINKLEKWVGQLTAEINVASPPFFAAKNLMLIMAVVVTGGLFLSLYVLIRWESIFK